MSGHELGLKILDIEPYDAGPILGDHALCDWTARLETAPRKLTAV